MRSLKKTFTLGGCLLLATTFSCEIEDEFSHPDRSEHLGTKIFTGTSVPVALLWSENTNEIIEVNYDGIIAIDAESKKTRKLPFDASYSTPLSAWLVGNTIYQLNSGGDLSRVNLTTLSRTGIVVDSALFQTFSSPFTTTHFAYAKQRPTDLLGPSIFLYDLESHEETYVGLGLPYVFSPDGQQLVISSFGEFLVYDLTTKATTSLNITEDYGSKLITWTSDGIISFEQRNESILARNESTNKKIGEWKSAFGLYGGIISPSAKHIIASEAICLNGSVMSGYCPYGAKWTHSIVDVSNNVVVPMAYTINTNIALRAFSPDEKTFALVTYDNSVYITEPQN